MQADSLLSELPGKPDISKKGFKITCTKRKDPQNRIIKARMKEKGPCNKKDKIFRLKKILKILSYMVVKK